MSKHHRGERCGFERERREHRGHRGRCQAPNYMVYPYGAQSPAAGFDPGFMMPQGPVGAPMPFAPAGCGMMPQGGCPAAGMGGSWNMMPQVPMGPPQEGGGCYMTPQGPVCPTQGEF